MDGLSASLKPSYYCNFEALKKSALVKALQAANYCHYTCWRLILDRVFY